MSQCRFENRLTGQAREMRGFRHAIRVHGKHELANAFAEIEAARKQGLWLALLLDYELGEWLEPAFEARPLARPLPSQAGAPRPRLTALVYEQMAAVPIWPAHHDKAPISRAQPGIRKRDYQACIGDIRAAIARGDLYQVNFTFPISIESALPPETLYRAIAGSHPAAHCAYVEDGARRILSFSPELFLERRGDMLTVRPMKGTAPRHADPVLDAQASVALKNSEKDRAENLMIVDLLRNDLGRIATPGSVNVDALFSLERYPSVWTMTSTITARAPGVPLEELLRALFPCGSITGAPKIAAMHKIRQLEAAERGIYCGSVGWLAPDGDCSLNVAIRSLEMHNERNGVFGVGGGIVHDSDPEQEWQECHWKARILNQSPETA
ncbi:aminodeoxychorismate synthase component I [Alcaligenaceae bacterium]|nr:aminodeoxychorismate synthase component I [Alcaligenaceae bacterium]